MDESLSSLASSFSVSESKQARKERRKRERSELLELELENEPDLTLSDESVDEEDAGSRKLSLSPTQFLQSRATGPLNRSRAIRLEAMENPPASASPVQVLEEKGKETSVDVPVEAVASVIASGANSIQRDNQGSSSVSPPSPSFNLPPTERAQLLHRSLAAELIQAESGRSPLIPPARHSQEPGTAISMSAHIAARRNNLNSSSQVQVDQRTVEELRLQAQAVEQARVEQLRLFGEACVASVTEAREAARSAQSDLTTGRQTVTESMEQTLAATRLRTTEVRN